MNIVQEKTGELTANIKINLTPEDYQAKVEKAIKDLQKKAQMPGFRPGKVPMGLVKKMYGKSVLVEEVNKVLVDSMYDYIKENNLNILGNPLPDDTKTKNIDWDNQSEFEFWYEIGLSPEIKLELSDAINVNYHKIKVDEKTIDDTIEDVRKRNGLFIYPEVSAEEDVLAGELQEVDGNGNVLENGLKNQTNIYVQFLKDDETKNLLSGKMVGESVVIDLVKAVENETEMAGMLGIKKDELEKYGKDYLFTITSISRREPAEINEELFSKVAPDAEIKDLDAFRNYISEQISKQYQTEVDRNFRNEAIKVLLTEANLTLPEEFLKRWLVESNRDKKEITAEQVEKEFDVYGDTFKWQLIENYLIKEHKIEVGHTEVSDHLGNYMRMQLKQYGQANPEQALIDSFVARIINNKDEVKKVYDQLFDEKVLKLLKEKLNLVEKEVTFDEFLEEIREKYKNKNSNQG